MLFWLLFSCPGIPVKDRYFSVNWIVTFNNDNHYVLETMKAIQLTILIVRKITSQPYAHKTINLTLLVSNYRYAFYYYTSAFLLSRINRYCSRPRWSRGNVLASGSKLRGFKPDWNRWIFSGRKNSEHKSSRRESEISGSLKNLKPEKIGLWANFNRRIHVLILP